MAVSIHGNNGVITTNGTADAPSLAAPDNDTGLYFGTNLIHTSTSGTERLRITADGYVWVSKTSSADKGKFEVKGFTADNIETSDISAKTIATFSGSTPGTTAAGKGAGIVIKPIADRGCNYFLGVANDSTNQEAHGRFIIRSGNFYNQTVERLRITSDGDLLVGTTSGGYRLNVQEDLNSGGNLVYFANSDSTYNQGLTLSFDSNKDIEWSGGSGAGGMDWNMGTRGYVWRVQGADKLRLGSGGLLSIDATSYEALKITTTSAGNNGPEVQLIHNSSSPAANDCIGQLRFSGKDSAGNTDLMARIESIIDSPTSGDESAHLNFGIRGQSAFNTTLRIKRRGTASAPSYTADDIDGLIFDVYNEGSGTGYKRHMSLIAKSAGNTNSDLTFWTEVVGGSPTEKLRITSDGQLIHKANKNSGYIAEFHQLHADNPGTIQINSPTDNNLRPAAVHLAQANAVKWVIGQVYSSTSSQAFHICAGTGESNSKLTIDTAGRVFIGRVAQYASSSEKLSVNGMTSIQYASSSSAGLYIFNTDSTSDGTIQPYLFCHDGSGIRAGLGVQRSTGITALNGQFGLSLRSGASGVGGTERLKIQSDGTKIITGGKLNISSTYIDFSGSISTPSTAAAIYRPADNNLAFSTANLERFKIENGYQITCGNSAISSNTTRSTLRIHGSCVNTVGWFGELQFKNRNDSGGAVASIRAKRDDVAGGNYSAGLSFHTNNGDPSSAADGAFERMRIESGGLTVFNHGSPFHKINVGTSCDLMGTVNLMNEACEFCVRVGDGNQYRDLDLVFARSSCPSMMVDYSYGAGYTPDSASTGQAYIQFYCANGNTLTSSVVSTNCLSQPTCAWHNPGGSGDVTFRMNNVAGSSQAVVFFRISYPRGGLSGITVNLTNN